MSNRTTILLLILIYCVSAIGSWYAVHWNYEHRWTKSNPRFSDLILITCPVLNTFFFLYWLLDKYLISGVNWNKFFKIEKR